MGQIQRMKSLLFLALLAFARSEWTCEECEKVMKTVLESDISEEGIQQQVDILLAEVCPQLEDVDTCVERLPRFWADLSPVMWTFAFQTDVWCREVCPNKVYNIYKIGRFGDFLQYKSHIKRSEFRIANLKSNAKCLHTVHSQNLFVTVNI